MTLYERKCDRYTQSSPWFLGELPSSQEDIEIQLEFQTNVKLQPESSEVEYYEFENFKIDTRWVTYGFLGAVLIICLVFLGLLFAALAGGEMTTREYFVGIDEIEWDYAPDGVDACHGQPFAYPQVTPASELFVHLTVPQSRYFSFSCQC